MAARCVHGAERRHEGANEQHETERTELCERLEVEAVRIEHWKADASVAKPEPMEASGSSAEPRVILVLAPGDMPVLGTAVSGKAEEPLTLVRLDERRRRRKRPIGPAAADSTPAPPS